ncbi:MAG: hypothetical protein LBV28_01695, partial [Puniceicoccales bacterium]|nr:hypothetical protein [Puniceicoccales bacterium]
MSRNFLSSSCFAALFLGAATLPVAAQRAGYREVVADEFVRQFLVSQYFSQELGVSGGTLSLPGSLSDSDINQQFINISGRHASSWDLWYKGLLQMRTQLTFGAAWNDDKVPVPAAGLVPDRTQSTSVSGSFGNGFRWRRWSHTTAILYTDIGLQYLQNRYNYNSPQSWSLAPARDGSTRNWFAATLTSITEIGIHQSIPLVPGVWKEGEDEPVSPWLRFHTKFSNISQIGFYGRNSDQRRFVSSFVWTSGVEVYVPLGTHQGKDFFLAPFFQFSDMHDDGNRSITRDGHLYRAGTRLGFRNKTDMRDLDSVHLTGTAYLGKGLTGWQVGMA